jgi:hypothetical protein
MLIWSDIKYQTTINTLLNMSNFNPLNHSHHEKIDFLHFGRPCRLWTVIFIINSQNFTFSVNIQCFKPPFSILLNFFNAYLLG